VGPHGEEIHTDEMGRVRVHFHWDRESLMNEKSSAWIPVARPAAGAAEGFVSIPRVGQEVIISFLNGDPDQPVIIGLVHTITQGLPSTLPANKTESVWKSRSTPGGGGFNEVAFRDAAGQELFRMRAERDFEWYTGNDRFEYVVRDMELKVAR
jgi:type VI secretion system secreted protein VgrG